MRYQRTPFWRHRAFLLAVITVVALPASAAEPPADFSLSRRIVVVSPSDNDMRLAPLREAMSFWNTVLADLKVDLRLIESALLIASPHGSAFENYTRKIWQQAGRQRFGEIRLGEPPALLSVGGDTVVFFSEQPTMSFAWPLQQSPRYFIAIPPEPGSPMNQGGTTRNVIAHELGHSLGLVHRGGTTVLMCSPCRTHEAKTDERGFLLLTDDDRQRLRELYQRSGR